MAHNNPAKTELQKELYHSALHENPVTAEYFNTLYAKKKQELQQISDKEPTDNDIIRSINDDLANINQTKLEEIKQEMFEIEEKFYKNQNERYIAYRQNLQKEFSKKRKSTNENQDGTLAELYQDNLFQEEDVLQIVHDINEDSNKNIEIKDSNKDSNPYTANCNKMLFTRSLRKKFEEDLNKKNTPEKNTSEKKPFKISKSSNKADRNRKRGLSVWLSLDAISKHNEIARYEVENSLNKRQALIMNSKTKNEFEGHVSFLQVLKTGLITAFGILYEKIINDKVRDCEDDYMKNKKIPQKKEFIDPKKYDYMENKQIPQRKTTNENELVDAKKYKYMDNKQISQIKKEKASELSDTGKYDYMDNKQIPLPQGKITKVSELFDEGK